MEIIETKSGHVQILGQLALLADSFIMPEEALRLVPEARPAARPSGSAS
jgi:hypothetical protein